MVKTFRLQTIFTFEHFTITASDLLSVGKRNTTIITLILITNRNVMKIKKITIVASKIDTGYLFQKITLVQLVAGVRRQHRVVLLE